MGGAKCLQTKGVREVSTPVLKATKLNESLALSVLCAARRIYFRIGCCSILLGAPLGYLYLTSVGSPYSNLELGIGWGIFSFAIFINSAR